MPTYNGQLYIEKAVNSVLSQTMADFELLIVDDGSKDETPTILAAIAKNDPRVKVITRASASGGPTIPKNQALSQVNSPYVCFLDHDDYYHPDKLAQMCLGMDAHPEWVAAFHDLQLVDADEKPYSNTYLSNAEFLTVAADYLQPLKDGWFDCGADFYIFMSLRYAGMHTDSVILAPQRLLADPVSFRLRFRGSDDTDLWLRAGSQGAVGFLNTVLAYYRQHDNNLSSDKVAMAENGLELHRDNYLRAKPLFTRRQLVQYRRKLNSYQSGLAYFLYKDKQFSKARAVYADLTKQGVVIDGLRGIAKTLVFQVMNKLGSA
jgi:glycosyltransferase involved in cell wall biosynthesis